MPADQLKAMWAIENCRTGTLGGAVYACQQCGKAHSIARSCGNRHCPACQSDKGKLWLEKQLARLLPCPYFFLCFTVPESARKIMRAHPKECYSILMDAAAAALMSLAKNPKYVGSSRLSMTAVLHTWGRDLSYNPHVHFVVAAGGLSADGKQWLPSRVDYLVPVMALSVIYRAKVRDKLKAADCWTSSRTTYGRSRGSTFQSCWRWPSRDEVLGSLHLPSSHQRSQGPVDRAGPDGQGQVTYDYRPVGSRQTKSMSVTAPEFIRRFVQHVLPSGFRKVRHYGLASARSPMTSSY